VKCQWHADSPVKWTWWSRVHVVKQHCKHCTFNYLTERDIILVCIRSFLGTVVNNW
jgi:hypothetical protein